MKIEKLTENKIRIILMPEDLEEKDLDLHTIMARTAESQGLLLEILSKAKKEIVRYIEKNFSQNISVSTSPYESKFNIFKWKPQEVKK